MKPITTWPLISTICALGTIIVSAVATAADSDDGNPLPRLTTKMVEQFAYYGCTNEEIANLFLISESHLLDRYELNLIAIRAKRIYDIRRAQFEVSVKKLNPQMLTWLGRNEMNQSLEPERDVDLDDLLPPKVG
jgi:hypothetical protein